MRSPLEFCRREREREREEDRQTDRELTISKWPPYESQTSILAVLNKQRQSQYTALDIRNCHHTSILLLLLAFILGYMLTNHNYQTILFLLSPIPLKAQLPTYFTFQKAHDSLLTSKKNRTISTVGASPTREKALYTNL